MAFQGSLNELPLPDIVQLVSVSGKTGRFVLTKDDKEGIIHLKDGQIVHAETPTLKGEEAVYALAIWDHGEFQFLPGDPPKEQTIEKSNTTLLMEAARRLDEWKILARKIPSIEMVPELKADEARKDQVTLNPREWLVVATIDGSKSITEIAEQTSSTAFDVAKLLYGMVTADIVTLKKKSPGDTGESGSQNRKLMDLASRIRNIADSHLGEPGQEVIEKHYAEVIDGIGTGNGPEAIRKLVRELDKAAEEAAGEDTAAHFRVDIADAIRAFDLK